ncbi:MAG: hypothetical protein Q9195_009571 [Heterodermia aff. obscurata]
MALIPHLVDERAKAEPEALYAEYPVSTLSYDEGYAKITYSRFANAINGVAWWLSETLGPGKNHENLAYIGPNDLRYPAFILGAVKAGYTPLMALRKGAYIVSHLFDAIPFGTVLIAPTSGAIPSAEGLVAGLKQTPADIAFLVPSIVQELSQNSALLDYCARHLQTIFYCGGDLPQSIGDVVATKIRLLNQFGATELGLTPNILALNGRHAKDWKYVQFHPDLGLSFRHTTDDLHELYVIHDPRKEDTQPTFTLFPELREYGSRDLFVRHPSSHNPDLWSWRARADDIIVFLNGEKTNPISMQQYIVAKNPDVSAALVIGAQRFQAAIMIEPVTGALAS